MNSIEEILALVRSVNADEFEEQLTSGQELDDLLTEIRFLTEKLESRKQRMHEMIEQITECFAGNFFQELPISDEQDELDVISMGFNTYMEELNDVMVSKDELEIKNKELIKANKDIKLLSKVKDEFLSGMSHEIRTPLNGMIGFTNILINNTNLTEQQNKLLEAIKTSGDILLVIVNDILDISKIESGKMILEENPIHLIEITQLIIDTFSVKINEKKLIVKLETTEVLSNNLLGDSVRISQILINLFSNAIKFTPQNGSITIELKTVKEENQKSTIEFSVIDTGIGIPKDKLDSVFEAFVQTSDDTARKYGGTGLGLSIVQKLLELMNGEIKVESEFGVGTKFIVTIPFTINSKINMRNSLDYLKSIKHEEADKVEDKVLKILLAEDNLFNQLLTQTILAQFNYEVTTVENGLLAFEAVQSGDYDIVIMDLMMPIMNGYEASEHIRTKMIGPKKMIPILAVSADVTKDVKEKCIISGINDYLSKPYTQKDLIDKIKLYTNR
ncbi:MAG: signal transduction histidine kinase/ActR/RegA family two-component response regulator [bacterium]|jgi:signal transduction histidine kinase/ActR/RegA family two-component response regulator